MKYSPSVNHANQSPYGDIYVFFFKWKLFIKIRRGESLQMIAAIACAAEFLHVLIKETLTLILLESMC